MANEAKQERDELLEPFVQAAEAMLRDWCGTEVVARDTARAALPRTFGDLAATMALLSADGGRLVLNFRLETGTRLAARILGRPDEGLENSLIRDCLAELANLIAGHAKALLANTVHRFALTTPATLPSAELPHGDKRDWRIAAFDSDLGPFLLQVSLAQRRET